MTHLQMGQIKCKINLQFKLRPNRNACKVHDFEKFDLQKYFIIPMLNVKILQSHLEELDQKRI